MRSCAEEEGIELSSSSQATAIPGAEAASGDLFVRKSSGLVREVGVRDSIAMGLSPLLLVAVYSVTAIFLDAFPNGDFYVPILIGAFVSVILAFAYAQLVSTFPRAGGEYVYATRTFTPIAGAFVGGLVLIGLTLILSTNLVQTCQVYVPFMFSTIGHAFHSHALQSFATGTLAHKTAWVICGILLVGFCVIACLRPIHTVARWVFWTMSIGLAVELLIAVILLFETRTGFIHAFNSASGGHNAYQQIIAQARAHGFHAGITFHDVVALLPIGALLFLGFTFGNYAAGEIKRPSKTYKIAVFSAIGIGGAGLLLGWAAMRHAAGLNFLQSSASLSSGAPATYEKLTSIPQVQGGLAYAVLSAGDPVSSIVIGVGTLIAWISPAVAVFMLCTRIVFALSFDRLIPTKLAEVSPRTHAPVYAVAFVGAIVLALTTIGNTSTLLTLFRNFLLVSNAILAIGCLCAAVLPYRRPELFAASPPALRGRLLGIPVISIVSGVAALAFTGLVVDIGARSQYSGGYSSGSLITLAITALCGGVLYAVSRWNMSRRGIDLRLAMKELPPE
jgi:basic amino acid/polyamine antiporter, APA family